MLGTSRLGGIELSSRLGAPGRRIVPLIFAAVLLLAALARFAVLDSLPPGWRDDELIEVEMDMRIADGWRPLYIEEAEGHEPLYHYVHAATIALFGPGRFSYRWLGAACGLVTVALTMALGRRLFGWRVALLAGAAMAVSFWPLMYSRLGLRHIGTQPALLLAIYALWRGTRTIHNSQFTILNSQFWWFTLAGLSLAAGLYTYFAGRVVPLIAIAFALYLLLFHRPVFKTSWKGWLSAGALAALLFAPLGTFLANRPIETRLEVVGKPLLELQQGNFTPMLETTLGTLGMFTFRGDPEWLYNLADRPVFDWLTGAFFYLGVALALWRWKRAEYGLLLIWLIGGLAPAFASLPAASFGHTIAALPAVYLLMGIGLDAAVLWFNPKRNRGRWVGVFVIAAVLVLNAGLTARDYVHWSQRDMVRLLYHADMADLARALREHPDIQDIAIATTAEELQLDARALALDLPDVDVRPRLFDSQYALVLPADQPAYVALTTYPPPAEYVEKMLKNYSLTLQGSTITSKPAFQIYQTIPVQLEWADCRPSEFGAGHLTLTHCAVTPQKPTAGQSINIATAWRVGSGAALPSTLKLFFHLIAPDGQLVAAGDRLDVWPPSLRAGDVFIQFATINLPADLPAGGYTVQAGVYDAATNERWGTAAPLGTLHTGNAP